MKRDATMTMILIASAIRGVARRRKLAAVTEITRANRAHKRAN
jgi:hypothetical protein